MLRRHYLLEVNGVYLVYLMFYNDVATSRVGFARLGYRPSGRVSSGSGIIAFVI